MNWNLEEAIAYYKRQGAPGDQSAVISLLREVQQELGGSIPAGMLPAIAKGLGTKESLLQAIIKRIPSLRLANTHTLEICCGPNSGKHTAILACAETLCRGTNITVKQVPCMRLCGKGPNIRWDGQLYHKADEALLQQLISGK